MPTGRYDICAVVVSHLPHDARVWKEARSLAAAGRSVRLIGLNYDVERPREFERDGVVALEYPFGPRGQSGLLHRAVIAARLAFAVLRSPAAVYHCHNIHLAPAVLLAASLRRSRIVYDAHELYGEPRADARPRARLEAFLSRLTERVVIRRAAAVITTNRSRAEVLEERFDLTGIRVVANVPALVERIESDDPGFPSGPVLLYQGGIYAEERAFRETIAALAQLPEWSLAVVGFGRDGDIAKLREWAREHGVAERLHLYEAVPFERLVAIAATATVGIVPLRNIDLNCYLGDTNKLFEYLMAGLPVVGSDFPEVARVLAHGSPRIGEVFDPERPQSIAEAVRLVAGSGYERRREEARRVAVEMFSWEIEAEGLVETFDAVLAGRR